MGKSKVKILFLCHRVPTPYRGSSRTALNVIKHLSKKHEVHVVYLSFSRKDLLWAKELEKFCSKASTTIIKRPVLGAVGSIFSLRPSSFGYFYSKKLKEIVDSIDCDLIFIRSSQMAMYVSERKERKIGFIGDADSEKWKTYSKEKLFPLGPFYYLEYLKVKRWEKKIVKQCEKIIVISEPEKELLSKDAIVMPNGVKIPKLKKTVKAKSSVIFLGVMDYRPNVEGTIYFHDEILPLIKKQVPDVKFVVAGMNPAKKLKKLKNATVTGFVEDMTSLVASQSVFVSPLKTARGVQNKILDAMAAGVPVVSTSLANQGILAEDGREILIADTPVRFAEKVMRLLNDKKLREKISLNAKRFIKKKFDLDTNLKMLDNIVYGVKS